jgi:hypothetical protein
MLGSMFVGGRRLARGGGVRWCSGGGDEDGWGGGGDGEGEYEGGGECGVE